MTLSPTCDSKIFLSSVFYDRGLYFAPCSWQSQLLKTLTLTFDLYCLTCYLPLTCILVHNLEMCCWQWRLHLTCILWPWPIPLTCILWQWPRPFALCSVTVTSTFALHSETVTPTFALRSEIVTFPSVQPAGPETSVCWVGADSRLSGHLELKHASNKILHQANKVYQ